MKQETNIHKASRTPAPQDPIYYKGFWGHYKGHVQGILRGTVLGLALGALLGTAVVALAPVVLPLLTSAAVSYSAGSVIAAFAGTAAIFAGHIFGRVGGGAGNVAAVHATEELRARYPNSDLHELGHGHHYESAATKEHGKWFIGKVGVPGAMLGGAVGGLLGAGGVASTLFHAIGLHVAAGTAGAWAIPAVVMGTLGMSYGINRAKFKTLFNWTDDLPQGDLKDLSPEQKGRIERMQKLMDPNSPEHHLADCGGITPKQYQSEYQRLYKDYYETAFRDGIAGNIRGMVGGYAVGILSGAVLGGLLLLVPGIGIGAAGLGALVAAAAFGGGYAVEHFTHAGAEAGGHAAVIGHWERKRERLIEQAGENLSLKEHVELENAISAEESNHRDKRFFSGKMLLIGTAGGALLGLALAPVSGPFVLAKLGIDVAAASATALATSSSLLCGLIGSTFGIGNRVIHSMSKLGDAIYDGIGSKQVEPSPAIPVAGPGSDLHILAYAQQNKAKELAAEHCERNATPPLPAHVRDILERTAPASHAEKAEASYHSRPSGTVLA